MKIERVDDKTVKCLLTFEELSEYDISYKDFINRSEKAKEVVEKIVAQAVEEVGYRPPQFAMDLQIMMIPDQGMVLVFSEKTPEDLVNGAMSERLKEFKNALENTLFGTQKGGKTAGKGQQDGAAGQNSEENVHRPQVSAIIPDSSVFAFECLGDICNLAKVLPANLRVESRLYKLNDVYYLYIGKGGASNERYSRTCIQALEFGYLCGASQQQVAHYEEQAECIIAEKALKKLAF